MEKNDKIQNFLTKLVFLYKRKMAFYGGKILWSLVISGNVIGWLTVMMCQAAGDIY